MGRPESTRTCTNCHRPHYARGLCRLEYRKWRRREKLEQPRPKVKICDHCERKVFAKGLCKSHYFKKRYHDPLMPRCNVKGCDNPRHVRGMCTTCERRRKS